MTPRNRRQTPASALTILPLIALGFAFQLRWRAGTEFLGTWQGVPAGALCLGGAALMALATLAILGREANARVGGVGFGVGLAAALALDGVLSATPLTAPLLTLAWFPLALLGALFLSYSVRTPAPAPPPQAEEEPW